MLELIEDASNELPDAFRLLVQRLLDHLKDLDRQVDELEEQIVKWHRQSSASSKLAQVPGIGPITASALVASLGDAQNFDGGRQVAVWLGLVIRQKDKIKKQEELNHRLLRRSRSDGKTGQTVVDIARATRSTQRACKRLTHQPANPIRDSD